MMAFDKELRPDHHRLHHHTLRRGISSEDSLSPEYRSDIINRIYAKIITLLQKIISTHHSGFFLNHNNINGYSDVLSNIISDCEWDNTMQTLTLKYTPA